MSSAAEMHYIASYVRMISVLPLSTEGGITRMQHRDLLAHHIDGLPESPLTHGWNRGRGSRQAEVDSTGSDRASPRDHRAFAGGATAELSRRTLRAARSRLRRPTTLQPTCDERRDCRGGQVSSDRLRAWRAVVTAIRAGRSARERSAARSVSVSASASEVGHAVDRFRWRSRSRDRHPRARQPWSRDGLPL